jgi:hypothetical protein
MEDEKSPLNTREATIVLHPWDGDVICAIPLLESNEEGGEWKATEAKPHPEPPLQIVLIPAILDPKHEALCGDFVREFLSQSEFEAKIKAIGITITVTFPDGTQVTHGKS